MRPGGLFMAKFDGKWPGSSSQGVGTTSQAAGTNSRPTGTASLSTGTSFCASATGSHASGMSSRGNATGRFAISSNGVTDATVPFLNGNRVLGVV